MPERHSKAAEGLKNQEQSIFLKKRSRTKDILPPLWCLHRENADDAAPQCDTRTMTFEDLYAHYGPMTYRRCKAILGDEQSAMDAMQDVFMGVLRQAPAIENPSAFLWRSATNHCLNLIRGKRRHAAACEHFGAMQIARFEPAGSLWARFQLDALNKSLGEDTRTMLFLFHVDGMTYEQVAQVMNMSASGVRKRLKRLQHFALQEVAT